MVEVKIWISGRMFDHFYVFSDMEILTKVLVEQGVCNRVHAMCDAGQSRHAGAEPKDFLLLRIIQ